MDHLDQLPEITDHALSGLSADDSLKQRILLSAVSSAGNKRINVRTALALCCISLFLLLTCFIIKGTNQNIAGSPQIHNIPAGSHRIVSPVNMQDIIDQATTSDSQ